MQAGLISSHVWLLQPETTIRFGEAKISVDRKMGRHLQTLSRIPGFLAATVSFKTQQVMLGSTWNKMIAVFAIGIPACVVGGVAYSLASGRDILTGFIQAYGALYKIPGTPFCRCHNLNMQHSIRTCRPDHRSFLVPARDHRIRDSTVKNIKVDVDADT